MRIKDLTGQKINKLFVIRLEKINASHHAIWLCKCDCGKECMVWSSNLTRKRQVGCGCGRFTKENKINHSDKDEIRLYSIWKGMKNRCKNPSHKHFSRYGGRGIKVDEDWEIFKNFLRDMGSSYKKHVGMYGEKKTTIDRIDNNGGYCKENCRWATPKIQSGNKRLCSNIEICS